MYVLPGVRNANQLPANLHLYAGKLTESFARLGVAKVLVDTTAGKQLTKMTAKAISEFKTIKTLLISDVMKELGLKSVLIDQSGHRTVMVLGDPNNLAKINDFVIGNVPAKVPGERHLSAAENGVF
jgi:hypothetical protein